MPWVICFFLGLILGAGCAAVCLLKRYQELRRRETLVLRDSQELHNSKLEFTRRAQLADAEHAVKVQKLQQREEELTKRQQEFQSRIISYDELGRENAMLKRDLQNIDVNLHKLEMDYEVQAKRQSSLDERSNELASRYLKETVKLVGDSLTANNFANCKKKLLDVIERCRDIGFNIPASDEHRYVADLKAEFELAVRAAVQREEQAKIKAQIREEEKLRREIEREQAQIERERVAVQAALDRALAEAQGRHSEEVEQLKARLAEAESKERAISLAQQTRAGHIYVISNIGSFGKGVFKIGMTRRLEPLDRVRELGDASVPFPFDVHMVISCPDAPTLENTLHRALQKMRINRVNPRKEYFRTDIDTIVKIVEQHHGCKLDYVADSAALEYKQSLTMSEEDADYIESVFDAEESISGAALDE
jgi:hypothetical protein